MKKFLLLLFFAAVSFNVSASTVSGEQRPVDNPIRTVSSDPGFCGIFHSWGFIGDSLCSGEHEYHREDGSKGYVDLYEYSWGQRMCAAIGAEGENYSQGGETAEGWIEHFWNNPDNNNNDIDAKTSPKQAYIIALGVNDAGRGYPAGDVRKDINKDDYTKNAGTFAGYYGGIIQRVKSIQPDAKFFVVTKPQSGRAEDEFNKVIRSMPEVFDNVYVIDLFRYGPSYASGTNFRDSFFLGGHMNAAGYEYTAWMFMTYIDWIIRNNMDDFSQVAFIGTDYEY